MGLSTEDRLLILCSHPEISKTQEVTINHLLEHALDWEYILRASIRHGVSPLVYSGLRHCKVAISGRTVIPRAVINRLEALYQENCRRNNHLHKVVEEIVGVFQLAGLPVMGLKDLPLSLDSYPDPGMRTIGDIDLLIHHEDYEEAARCMKSLGFTIPPSTDMTYVLKYAWAHFFHRSSDNVWVDLQWNLNQIEWDSYQQGNFNFSIDRVWGRAQPMQVGGYQLLVPSTEDMLFHLCMHLEGHRYGELILMSDVAALLSCKGESIDWTYLVSLTREYHVESSVYYALLLIRQLFEVEIPQSALDELIPTWFNAQIHDALYGNLAGLHAALGDINKSTMPPEQAMLVYEAAARYQAACSMLIYREVKHLAAEYHQAGGSLMWLDGKPSTQFFPDPALSPVGELRLLLLNDNKSELHTALLKCGFTQMAANSSARFDKISALLSADPLVHQSTKPLGIQCIVCTMDDYAAEPVLTSKKLAALSLIWAKMWGRPNQKAETTVVLKAYPGSREEILVAHCRQFARENHYRLFQCISLVDFFARVQGKLDWKQVICIADQFDADIQVAEALLIVMGLRITNCVPDEIHAWAEEIASPPHLLEWARAGPIADVDLSHFKRLFIVVINLLTIECPFAKLKYIFLISLGGKGYKPILPAALWEVAKGILIRFLIRRKPDEAAVYWTDQN